jgi:predicted LPLAT superfamily acyltransferase
VIASLVIGKSIPGLKELEGPMSHFYQWLVGGAIFGAVAGTILGVLTYVCIYSYRRSAKRLKDKRVSHHARQASLSVLIFCLRRFGMIAGRLAGLFMSAFMWAFSRESRRALQEYLALVKPELSWVERQKEIFEQLLAYNESRIDRLYNRLANRSAFGVQAEGLTFIENAPSALIVSAHAGSPRLAAELLDLPVHLLMCDRLRNARTELLLFFGKLAPFDVSAFREAAETGRPVIFCFAAKQDGGYRFKAQSPRQFTFNNRTPRDTQVLEMAREFTGELEKFVHANPRRWFNLFPFWSEVPANETGVISNRLFEELKPEAVPASGKREPNRSIHEH